MKKQNFPVEIGDLYYLSGTGIGRRTKQQRKEKRKEVFKKVAKVSLAAARGAFLTLITLNALKLAVKMAKAWQKDKAKVITFWQKFGGEEKALKEAIIKGSKMQISGADMGVAIEAVLATAVPILIALKPLLKELNIFEGKQDEQLFDGSINQGTTELENNPQFEKTTAQMPQDEKSAILKNGDKTFAGFNLQTVLKSPINTLIKFPMYATAFVGVYSQSIVVAFLLAGICVADVFNLIPYNNGKEK
jgi:hypothetical protein